MSMVYDPVTKEFRPRTALNSEYKARTETHERLVQQATASDSDRQQIRRRHQVQRLHLKQDLVFWSVLLTAAILLAGLFIWLLSDTGQAAWRLRVVVPPFPTVP